MVIHSFAHSRIGGVGRECSRHALESVASLRVIVARVVLEGTGRREMEESMVVSVAREGSPSSLIFLVPASRHAKKLAIVSLSPLPRRSRPSAPHRRKAHCHPQCPPPTLSPSPASPESLTMTAMFWRMLTTRKAGWPRRAGVPI